MLVLLTVVIVIAVSKAIASRFAQDPFFVLCSTAYMGLLFASYLFDPARPGNEFGPLAEVVFFYPLGLAFWIAGLVVLWRAFSRGEPLGRFRTALQCVNGLFYLGPALAIGWLLAFPPTEYTYELITELRAPAGLQADPLTRISVHTDTDQSTVALGMLTKRTEGDFTFFSTSFILSDRVDRRVLAEQLPMGPFQVFRLTIPRDLKPQDWTAWLRPDYLAQNDWRLLEDATQRPRSKDVPTDCFELRYRVDRQVLEKWKPPKNSSADHDPPTSWRSFDASP